MIRVLHRDGLVLELAAGGSRTARSPLRFPDASAARRLFSGGPDPNTLSAVRALLAAAGEAHVAQLADGAALDRLALLLVRGQVTAAVVRDRHTADNVGHAPVPDSVASADAPPPAPGVTPSVVAAVARTIVDAVAGAPVTSALAQLEHVAQVADYPLPSLSVVEQALYDQLSPAAKAFFDEALHIARTADVSSPQAVFWSGPGADKVAAAYARQHGFKSLESTPGGAALNDHYQNAHMWSQNPAMRSAAVEEIRKANLTMIPWSIISARYGANAHGEVRAFVTQQRRPNSVFYRVELPRALARGVSVVPVPGRLIPRPGYKKLVVGQPLAPITAASTRCEHLPPEEQRVVDFYTRFPARPNADQAATFSAVTRHYDGRYNPTPLTPAEQTRVTAIQNPPPRTSR